MRGRRLFVSLFLICSVFLLQPGVATADETLFLEAIGGFSGSYIYTTYAYIGATADAYAKDIYTAGQVKVMMDENVHMINKLHKLLERVRDSNISESDRKFVISMLDILVLLRTEAEALAAFSASQNPADVERYDQARKKVYPLIKKLLGMN